MNISAAVTRSQSRRTRDWPRVGLVLLVMGLVAVAARAQTTTSAQAVEVPALQPYARPSLDFKVYPGSAIVVGGSVGKLKNLHFLIDTGAYPSVADQRLAGRLGASKQPGRVGVFGNRVVNAHRTVLSDLQVGPLLAKSLPVEVLDLSSLEQELHFRIDMLIGLDVLGQSSFSINYESKRITFGDIPDLPLLLPMDSGLPLVTVTAQMNDVPYHLLVNTAASRLILFRANAPGMQEVELENADIGTNTVGGLVVCKRARLSTLRLGIQELGSDSVWLVNDGPKGFDGYLPIPALGFKEVAFDFKRQILGLRR